MPIPALFSVCAILNSLPVRDANHPCEALLHAALSLPPLEETLGGSGAFSGMPLQGKNVHPEMMLRDPHQEGKWSTKQPARLLEPIADSKPNPPRPPTPGTPRTRCAKGRAPLLLRPLLWGVALACVAPLYVLPDDAPGQLCPGQERDACSPSIQ